ARPRQLFPERDEIDGVAAFAQLDHLLEDPPVRVAVEVSGGEDLGGLVEGVVVDEHCAEYGALRFEIVRQRTVDCSCLGHGATPRWIRSPSAPQVPLRACLPPPR